MSTPIGVSPAADARYEHDRLSRLTCAAGPWVSSSTTYSYDPVGNRLDMVRDAASTGYGYDRADRITLAGTTSYSVNSRGNLITRGSDAFSYDQANRLTSATVGGTDSILPTPQWEPGRLALHDVALGMFRFARKRSRSGAWV